jgi:putative SOS response-associated peptidase YedK
MCGRYASFLPAEAIARIFGTVNPLPNVAPTNDCAVVRRHPQTGQRHLDLLTWGLLPDWTKEPAKVRLPIDARSQMRPRRAYSRTRWRVEGASCQRKVIA